MSFNVLHDIWWALIMIGIMILIHELGHYWAARFFDVKVDTFSFGFGPRLFGFKKGETDFRFSLILLGGYVKMVGEQPGDEQASLAAFDYRFRRPRHEHHSRRGGAHWPLHGPLSQDSFHSVA
jgi:RIP metalloprotease RseP